MPQRDAAVTSRIMAAVKSSNTEPEWLLRRAIHRAGLRYRLHARALPGTPDIVFIGARVAVFVDGDFWHGHGWRERGYASLEAQFNRNSEFWIEKIRRNIERDRIADMQLQDLGWRSVRILESEIRGDVARCVRRVQELVAPA
jgi:DNA mismatch endonuclease (patch repair protein)